MDEAVLYQTKNGKVAVSGDTPRSGDEVLAIPQQDGSYITSGPYPQPEPGDEGLIVQTNDGPVYLSGGVLTCEKMGASYWTWHRAGIDPQPWQGKHINALTTIWSSKEFRAIKFDIYFIGYIKIWAFGQVVVDMVSPTDPDGFAVAYHLQQTYQSDNPCGARACRMEFRPAGIMTFAILHGDVQVHIGRNGDVSPHTEVVMV